MIQVTSIDTHGIYAPGFPGDTINYDIGRDAIYWHWYRRRDAPPNRPWSGPFATYDDVIGALQAIESAGLYDDAKAEVAP